MTVARRRRDAFGEEALCPIAVLVALATWTLAAGDLQILVTAEPVESALLVIERRRGTAPLRRGRGDERQAWGPAGQAIFPREEQAALAPPLEALARGSDSAERGHLADEVLHLVVVAEAATGADRAEGPGVRGSK